jgi:membrane protein DedA with SNARE-associated domain
VILIAFAGSALGDQIYFFLGRRYGRAILGRFPRWQPRAARVDALLRRFQAPLIVVLRFLYGLRTVGPIAVGMSHVTTLRFILFDMLGALIWAPLVASVGYLFGSALELLLADVRRYEEAALWGFALMGAAVWVGYRLRERRKPGKEAAPK